MTAIDGFSASQAISDVAFEIKKPATLIGIAFGLLAGGLLVYGLKRGCTRGILAGLDSIPGRIISSGMIFDGDVQTIVFGENKCPSGFRTKHNIGDAKICVLDISRGDIYIVPENNRAGLAPRNPKETGRALRSGDMIEKRQDGKLIVRKAR